MSEVRIGMWLRLGGGLRYLVVAVLCLSNLAGAQPHQPQGADEPKSVQPASSSAVQGAKGDASQGSAAMPDMPGMSQGMTMGTAPERPWCSDSAWSTFNHRVSGWFLLLWGLAAFLAGMHWPPRTWWRFAAPLLLFGLAEFLFFRNDPEAWPVGPMSFWASLQDPEDLQHRVFLLLVILMAVVELLRATERLPGLLAKYALPALGTFGAIYLFFHKHGNAMDMMDMSLVRHEHLWFSLLGFGLVVAKLMGDMGYLKGRLGQALWPVFAILLGGYMIGYVE